MSSSCLRLMLLVGLTLIACSVDAAAPSFESVRASYPVSEGVLLDRHGEVIFTLRVDDRRRVLPWTSLDQVSPVLVRTLISAEDRRFYEHEGVDGLALAASAWQTVSTNTKRGGSTLTMQLAAQLDPALKPASGRRGLAQKWRQMRAAWEIERTWTKPQILEAYLNLATYRGELTGIRAAASGLFDKEPAGLDESEALLLVALLRSPSADIDALAKRACRIGAATGARISCDVTRTLVLQSLNRPPRIAQTAQIAPHVARQLVGGGERTVQSSLDAEIQRFAISALKEQLGRLAGSNVGDGAVLAVDNRTAEVIAYVGNGAAASSARYVDGVHAPRQAGSTLKPFLYELAFEQRLLTAASLLDDSPVNLIAPAGMYVPQNYDKEFHGTVTARTALGSSLNVPAVRTLMLVGTDPFVARLQGLGFRQITEDGDYYGYSLALGSAEVELWDLVNAYRTLANGGLVSELTLRPRKADSSESRVLDPAAAWIVSDILSDRSARSLTFGLDNPLAAPYWSAVKTGTSKDMRDNWCVGYSEHYTVGVWVGNFNGEPMRNVSGVSGAAPVWLAVMNALHAGSVSKPSPRPDGVRQAEVAFDYEVEARRTEFFLSGTETTAVRAKRALNTLPRITYPAVGAVIALDPDIPAARQRVLFRMQPKVPGFRWRVNGSEIAGRDGVALWTPETGSNAVALVDAAGHTVDEARFEVRGTARRLATSR